MDRGSNDHGGSPIWHGAAPRRRRHRESSRTGPLTYAIREVFNQTLFSRSARCYNSLLAPSTVAKMKAVANRSRFDASAPIWITAA